MSTLSEIQNALPSLSAQELAELSNLLEALKQQKTEPEKRSLCNLAPISLGGMRSDLGSRENWYDEMLEDHS